MPRFSNVAYPNECSNHEKIANKMPCGRAGYRSKGMERIWDSNVATNWSSVMVALTEGQVDKIRSLTTLTVCRTIRLDRPARSANVAKDDESMRMYCFSPPIESVSALSG